MLFSVTYIAESELANPVMDYDASQLMLRRIKAECDLLDLNAAIHHQQQQQKNAELMSEMVSSSCYGSSGGRTRSPPPLWPSTPTRPQAAVNDSGISPGNGTASDCATEGSGGADEALAPGSASSPSHSESGHFSAADERAEAADEDDEMMDDLEEEDEDLEEEEDVDDMEEDVTDAPDAISALHRSLDVNRVADGTSEAYQCHLCSFSAASRFHFQAHLNTHFDVKCTHCDFTARTEGNCHTS